MLAVRKFLTFSLLCLLAACGGGGSGSGGGSGATGTGIESEASKLKCTILINQNESDIDGELSFNCPKIFDVVRRNADTRVWSIGKENTCDFITIDSEKKLSGIANDDHVGDCSLIVHARTGNKITVYTSTIVINNGVPTLSIGNTAFNEDSSSGVIRINSEVQANEEGYGVYSLDNTGTTGTKCSDNGSLSINSSNGSVSFTPTLHYNGVCNVRVRFDDEHDTDNIVEDQFSVTIAAINDAPTITGDCATTSLNQDIAYSCNTIGVSDPEAGDTQTWSMDASNTCAWAGINSTTGAISGTPTDDQVGACTLAVKVNDGTVDSTVFSKAITVTNVTPVISALNTVQAILEDAAATVVLLAGDVTSDEEGYGVYSLDNANTTGTKCSDNGTVSIDVNTGAVTYTPAADYDGSCNVRVVFDDENPTGNTTFQEATINVTGVNDPAVITSTCTTSVNELAAYSCTGAYTDVESDTISWSLAAGTTCGWASIAPTTGNITGTPSRSDVGTCDVVIRANDGTDDTDETVSITVNNVAPVITVADTTLAEDAASTVIRLDADVVSSDEGFGSFSIIAASGSDCQDDGTVSIDASTGAVTYAPDANYDGICNINVQFNDGHAANNLGSTEFTVSMLPSADIATISLPAACDTDLAEDMAYTCTPSLIDPDTRQVGAAAGAASSADTHTWSIDANTCGFIPSIVAATGVMTGTANDDQVGPCTFTISVVGDQDALGANVADLTASFNVTNVKPILDVGGDTTPAAQDIFMHHTTAPASYSAQTKNTSTDFNFNSTDETYGAFSLATAASDDCSAVADTYTINAATGVVTFLPNDMYAGTCYIAVDFDDQNSTDNSADTLELQVNVVDEIPPLISYLDSSTADGSYYLTQTINVTVKFNEPVSLNTASGTPRIFLETGTIDRTAVYTGISGDATELYFDYEIQEDDKNADLAVHSTVTYLDQAGSLIEDLSGNTLPNFPIPKPADATGNSLSERRDLDIDGSIAEAEISGMPTRVSPDLVLDVDVSGGGVVTYRYKVTQVGTANDTCADTVGYSADIVEATNITDSLVPFPLGAEIRLCVIGKNGLGNEQPLGLATEYVWSKDVNSIQKVSFATVNNLPNWQDSTLDPDNKNLVYARNLLGEVYKSEDYGVNWVKQCTVPQTLSASMEVSPGPDRTPYLYQDKNIYKIEELGDVSCPNILSGAGFQVKRTGYKNNNLVHIVGNGDIYVATSDFSGVQIWRSFDQGTNWYYYATLSPAGTNDYNFDWSIDPNDISKMIYTKRLGTIDPSAGTYLTDDSGATWTRVTGEKGRNITWHPFNSSIVYRDYRAFSEISVDGGTTWTAAGEGSTGTYGTTEESLRYDIDKVTGNAYRLTESGSTTLLQVATNPINNGVITWSTVYTFSTNAGVGNSSRSVSVSGNSDTPAEPTIAVNILDRLWISSDGGTSFSEIFAPEELKLLTIAGAGDDAIYGATKDWRVVKTTDNGESWSYKTGDYYHCLGKPPRLHVNQIDVDNILMWTENYATIDCDTFNYSIDGMDSMTERDSFSLVSPKLLLSTSPYDPGKYYMSGKVTDENFTFHQTSNFAFETTLKDSVGNEFSDPMPDSFINPHDENLVWMVDNISSGQLYEYDLAAGIKSDITARTGLSSIAAIDVYTGDKGQYFLRAMDRTGRIKTSSDYGANFIDEGNTGAPLTTCTKRFLYHHPRDRNLIVTACLEGNHVAISKDSGTTWDETDVYTEYDIDCSLTGIAVSSSRMYLGCKNSDTMIFNYSFASLENDVADSVLTAGEDSNTTDLLAHFFPANYTTLEYAVIPASAVCDPTTSGTYTFSTTVPRSDDAGFTARGEYKVCIQQLDLAGATTYTTTSTIFYDTGSPTFTSIDLINDVADAELTNVEHNNDSLLVGNLNSSGHDFVKYAVVTSATTCNASVAYSFEIPKSNNEVFVDAGTYKVCVELTTRGGVSTVYGNSSNITYAPTQVTAILSGTPEAYISIDSALDVTISGTGVTQYMYKIIVLGADSCETDTGYSAAIPVGTKITDDLTGYSSGDNLSLCVLGGDASGYFQNRRTTSLHRWVYSTDYRMDRIDFSTASSGGLQDWRQIAIHPNNQNIIYGFNTMGEVWRSNDQGSSWDIQCKVSEYRSSMKLKVSPGDDNTAYISHHYVAGSTPVDYSILWRIDNYNGFDCSKLATNFRGVSKSNSVHTKFSLNQKGHLFLLEDQYDSIVIRKSTDQGRTWSFVGQLQNSGLYGQLYIDPKDEDIMLINTIDDNAESGTKGLYKSADAGKTWSFIQSTGFTESQQIYFDPVLANRVYANNSYYSTDNGSSWSTSSQFDSNGEQWWVDASGKGYRLEHSGSDTVLMRSNSLNPGSFSSLYVFSGVQADDTSQNMISATGNTIAVVIGGESLYISTDAGVSFSQVFWPGSHLQLTGISSTDGKLIYGVSGGWSTFKTSDTGDNWSYLFNSWDSGCKADARVITHHLNKNAVNLYSDSCRVRGFGSNDGLTTRNYYNEDTNVDETYFMMGIKDESIAVNMDANGPDFHGTSDSWNSVDYEKSDSFAQYGGSWDQRNNGVIGYNLKDDPSTFFIIKDDASLNYVNLKNEVEVVDINSRLTIPEAAGMAIDVSSSGLELNHIVMSQNGRMNISYNDGDSFSLLGTSSTGLTSCEERLIYINPENNNMIATSCNLENEIAWSIDRGSSWTRVDMDAYYGTDCAISGIVMNQSEIMFSCKNNYPAMRFNYNPVNLLGNLFDGKLTAGEISGATIASIAHSSYYSVIEYAVIASGGSCNVSTPGYSTTAPIDSDISGLGDGTYKICVKLDNGSITYKTSSEIVYDSSAPNFISIDLANEAIDGVQLPDYLETSNIIVNNISGSGYDTALYALVVDTTTCNADVKYSTAVPRTNSKYFVEDDNYKVCVALTDNVNPVAYGESASFEFTRDQVIATLSGEPNRVSADLVLDITVGGTDVDSYQYKVGNTTLDCTDSTGYSAETVVATKITENISGLSNGNVTLCVRGIDTVNHKDQTFYQATEYTWQKTDIDMNYISFNANSYAQNWFDVEVAKWDGAPYIYARDFNGHVFRSTDRGANFDLMCKVPHDAESRFSISTLKSHGAYVTSTGILYRIEALGGETCKNISGPFTSIVSTFQKNPVSFDSTGKMYALDEVSPTQTDLYSSTTLGESWTLVRSFTDTMTGMSINVDPHNDKALFLMYESTSTEFSDALIVSRDAGITFVGISPDTNNVDVSSIQDPDILYIMDPLRPGYMYANNAWYSSDNLFDITDGTGGYVDDLSRFDIDYTGQGYRLIQNGADIDVEFASDMSNGSFAVDKTISSVTADALNRTISVSRDGSTIAVVADKKMYISLDSAAYVEAFTPVVRNTVTSITSEDGTTAYAIDADWNVFKTTNSGSAWGFSANYAGGCVTIPRIRTNKSDSNYVLAYAEDGTNICENIFTTTDGFSNSNISASSVNAASWVTVAMDASDPNNIGFIFSSGLRLSTDFFGTMVTNSLTSVINEFHGFDGFLSTADNTIMFNVTNGKLYELDGTNSTKTDETSRLSFTQPSSIEGFPDGSAYAISRTGQLDSSADNGATFSSYAGDPSLTSCSKRTLRSSALDPANIISTACIDSNTAAYTLDGGSSWTEVNLASYGISSSCSIRDIAIINDGVNKLFISCESSDAVYIEMN